MANDRSKGDRDESARLPRSRRASLGERRRSDDRRNRPTSSSASMPSTICGTDLHILKGDVPEVTPGTILGHEAVGTVVATGDAVTTLAEDDRVLVSCITACGRCRFCKEGHYGLCMGGGGWIFGHLIDGLQAEYARVPFADTSVYKVPAGSVGRAGALPRRHPADGLRGRNPERPRGAGRHGRRRRRRPDRARDDHDGEAPHARARSSPSTSPMLGSRRRSTSARTSS